MNIELALGCNINRTILSSGEIKFIIPIKYLESFEIFSIPDDNRLDFLPYFRIQLVIGTNETLDILPFIEAPNESDDNLSWKFIFYIRKTLVDPSFNHIQSTIEDGHFTGNKPSHEFLTRLAYRDNSICGPKYPSSYYLIKYPSNPGLKGGIESYVIGTMFDMNPRNPVYFCKYSSDEAREKKPGVRINNVGSKLFRLVQSSPKIPSPESRKRKVRNQIKCREYDDTIPILTILENTFRLSNREGNIQHFPVSGSNPPSTPFLNMNLQSSLVGRKIWEKFEYFYSFFHVLYFN